MAPRAYRTVFRARRGREADDEMRTDIIITQPHRGADAIFDLVRMATRRRRSRREEAFAAVRDFASPKTMALAGAGLLAAAGLAYAGRRLFWQAVAVTAEAVEEAADAVEDAAEDLGEAARARADGESGDD
jgi:choline dehydrogenase-like flavoprotein